jgi:RNA polymerase sigma-70 factor (ECF subfamily)
VDPDRSFERIYRRHRREVYGSVLRLVRDPDEAEDVTQAAFLNAFRAMRRGDRPETPRAWLLTIARNVVRRRARLRSERPQEVELDADSELLVSLDDAEGSASADIHAALSRLTDAQREAILLREIQGRSYAEIAFELGLSLSAVEALIFRARRALAEELELVERVPHVRPQRRHGLLAIPGLAKLGSFGFSFGRVAAACMVGCAVVATVPVMDGSASEEPVSKPRKAHAIVAADPIALHEQAAPVVTAKKHKERKDSASKGGKKKSPHSSSPSHESSGGGAGASLLPLDLPPVDVQLPPVQLPPVEVPPLPSVEVPPVQLPPVQLPPAQLPPLPPLTS